jgi:hypothetical protein
MGTDDRGGVDIVNISKVISSVKVTVLACEQKSLHMNLTDN